MCMCKKEPWCQIKIAICSFRKVAFNMLHAYTVNRDLARTRPTSLLDRQFPDNLLFGQANISMKNFNFFGGFNQIHS